VQRSASTGRYVSKAVAEIANAGASMHQSTRSGSTGRYVSNPTDAEQLTAIVVKRYN